MSQGQIEALEHHASDEIKALYLPKLICGEWTGTMNLTEPQAGSDVGALTHQGRAERRRHLCDHRAEDLHHLGRQRFHRQRLPPGAGAPAGRGARHQGHQPVPGAQAPARRRRQARRGQRRSRWSASSTRWACTARPTCVMQYDGATGLAGRRGTWRHGGDVHDDEQRPPRRRRRRASAWPRAPISTRWPMRWSASRASPCRGRVAPSSIMPTCGGCC